jgi:hypothetical protein
MWNDRQSKMLSKFGEAMQGTRGFGGAGFVTRRVF